MHLKAVVVVVAWQVALGQIAGAQRGPQARLVLTIDAGATMTQPSLWNIPLQPLLVIGTEGNPQPSYDTISLARDFGTNLLVGLSGAYFPKPTVGLDIGVTGLGLTTVTSCRGVYFDSLLGGADRDLCTGIQGRSQSLGAIAVTAGIVTRAFPRSVISPHARGGIDLTLYSTSTTLVEGPTPGGVRIVVDDRRASRVALGFTAGIGASVALGPGYLFSFDLEDIAERFPRLAGPADRLARAPRAYGFSHHVILALGLGIVLESRRGRRY